MYSLVHRPSCPTSGSVAVEMWTEIVLALLTLFVLLYWYITKSFGKWKQLGIPYDAGHFPYGSYNLLAQKKNINDLGEEGYQRFKNEKCYGWFLFGKPVLGINDMSILKNIQVKDFNHFVDRSEPNAMKAFRSGGDLDKVWNFLPLNLYLQSFISALVKTAVFGFWR